MSHLSYVVGMMFLTHKSDHIASLLKIHQLFLLHEQYIQILQDDTRKTIQDMSSSSCHHPSIRAPIILQCICNKTSYSSQNTAYAPCALLMPRDLSLLCASSSVSSKFSSSKEPTLSPVPSSPTPRSELSCYCLCSCPLIY